MNNGVELEKPMILLNREPSVAEVKAWDDLWPYIERTEPWRLEQTWLSEPAPLFRPATVWVWASPDDLCVAAELEDADIFNPVTGFNEPAFQYGDVFEIFLRPLPGDTYYEIHVSPVNQLFQLRIPSSEEFYAQRSHPLTADWFVTDWIAASQVWVEPEQERWRVWVRLPLSRLWKDAGALEGLASFSRYDHTRGQEKPVHSSTSPHPRLDFHRQQEWRAFSVS